MSGKMGPVASINWVRAMFIGAILGGFLWAVIVRLVSLGHPAVPWQARMALIAGAVNGAALIVGWLRWRSATDERGRSLAAALWTVPFIGIAVLISLLVFQAAGELVGA